MNVKRILITALISLVAAGLVCVVLVGMINGVWPWSGGFFGLDYTPRPGETTQTTVETQETTTTATEETTETTTEASVPTTTTTTDDEEDSNRPTLENKIPVDVIVTQPTEGNDGAESDSTKPSDKTYIDFSEMYNPNKE